VRYYDKTKPLCVTIRFAELKSVLQSDDGREDMKHALKVKRLTIAHRLEENTEYEIITRHLPIGNTIRRSVKEILHRITLTNERTSTTRCAWTWPGMFVSIADATKRFVQSQDPTAEKAQSMAIQTVCYLNAFSLRCCLICSRFLLNREDNRRH